MLQCNEGGDESQPYIAPATPSTKSNILVFKSHDSDKPRYERKMRRSMMMVRIVMDNKVLYLTSSILKEKKISTRKNLRRKPRTAVICQLTLKIIQAAPKT